MLELTKEQQQAIRERPGQPVRVVDPQSKQAFFLVPEELFAKLREGYYDDGPWTEE